MAYRQAPINFGVGTGSSPLNNEPGKGRSWENPDVNVPKGTNENVSKHPLQGERPELSDTKVKKSEKHTTRALEDDIPKPEMSADMARKKAQDRDFSRETFVESEVESGRREDYALPFKGWFKKWRENREHKKFLKEQREEKVRRRDKR